MDKIKDFLFYVLMALILLGFFVVATVLFTYFMGFGIF